MPLLTDRQEPEDFDKASDETPNAYALNYLFAPRRPQVEMQRTGQVLMLAATGASILAGLVTMAGLDFQLSWLLLGIGVFIPFLSGYTTYLVWRQRSGYQWPLGLVVLLILGGIALANFLPSFFSDLAYLIYYLPGGAVLLISYLILRFKLKQVE